MSARRLTVWWDGRIAGCLAQDQHGDLSFAYDADWLDRSDARPLSHSLPLQPDIFDRRACRPFFGGLLPEADQRSGVAGALGVSAANEFALLDRLGGDVAGALTLLPEGEIPPSPAIFADPALPLSDAAFAAILDRLPHQPMLAGEAGLRMSLAGAQAKLPVILVDGRPALPRPGEATTHIVKPEIPRFAGSVANEAWCMALARTVGLDVAEAVACEADGRPYLLVTRYDRAQRDGVMVRLHQEDACQALGIPSERKYAAEGGPAFRDMFALTRAYVRQPAVDVIRLVDAAIFNLAIGNADAHGKNFSFLLDGDGPRLAPLYDLLSTRAWPELSARQAMRVGRAGMIEELDQDAWLRFASDAGITLPFLRRRIITMTDAIMSVVDEARTSSAIAVQTGLRAAMLRQSLD
ncbi:Serine/threonine-protein kinase toxin HipA (plasmid) [Sphingobium sp. AntQ-1]|uniref:type II toxin-antitoxin system HipA family toxin n=1 Tax=Sphingobium sp. AntQ-1 TaxID=2930091 RepID=UPI00234FA36D|nr:type II toxin-antitoxin system HipA family toxin [Sphingobium sp. AntQ-1]WCP16268.1 Serine/threonine-protein kinase toxin HipA [Sphingobium sp. AntQ-1]